jgi:DNA repair exonuclease SbcCD ATPase subunit
MGRRNKKLVKSSVGSPAEAVDSAHGVIEELMTEMQEWRDNIEGTGLENTEKFQTISESADMLESGENYLQDAVSSMEDIACDREVEYSYLQPYGRKPMNRADRFGEASSLLESAADVLEGYIEEIREEASAAREEADEAVFEAEEARDAAKEKGDAEAEAKAEAEVKAAEEKVKEAEEKAEKAEEKAQAVEDAVQQIRDAYGECESVEFPGMFG